VQDNFQKVQFYQAGLPKGATVFPKGARFPKGATEFPKGAIGVSAAQFAPHALFFPLLAKISRTLEKGVVKKLRAL